MVNVNNSFFDIEYNLMRICAVYHFTAYYVTAAISEKTISKSSTDPIWIQWDATL